MSRRAAIGVLAGALGTAFARPGTPALPVAPLGKTGRVIPRLGLGCYPLGNLSNEDAAVGIIHQAMDAGVRYFDTAPSYASGRSERRIGIALESWLKAHPEATRADFFIATKTLQRDGDGAKRELEQSLRHLRTGYVDSVQCHEVHEDWERLFAENAVVAALEQAREEQIVRSIGITGHRDPAHLVRAARRYPPVEGGRGFVTALVPVNPIDVQHRSFVREFLPVAEELGIAVIAMKVFGGGFLLAEKNQAGEPLCSAHELLRYALAQPSVAVVVPGCDASAHIDEAKAATVAFTQPEAPWLQSLEARMPVHKGKTSEWYKDAE
mgnify:CR=1 FL=1